MQLGADWEPFARSSQQLRKILRVPDGVIRIAVVENGVHLVGTLRHVAQVGDPRLQLAQLVQVTEFFCRADPFLLPGLTVASVKADHSQWRRHGDDRRHARDKALRLIDHDIGEAVLFEEFDDPRAPLLRHPQLLAKLDRDTEVREPLPKAFHESVGRWRWQKPLGKLKDDRAQLAGILEWLEPLPKTIPDALLVFRGKVFEIDVAFGI